MDCAKNKARNRQSVLQYWCELNPVIDHDLAQAARVELQAKDWSEDLLAEFLAFLGYMDPLSLTQDELQTILQSHSFTMIPKNCTAAALFNLNCEQLQKLTRFSTYHNERNRLTNFLVVLFGKRYYPWTLNYPRPGGKLEFCLSCVARFLSFAKGHVVNLFFLLLRIAVMVLLHGRISGHKCMKYLYL